MRTEKVEMLRITRKRNLEYLNNLLSFKMSEIYTTPRTKMFLYREKLCVLQWSWWEPILILLQPRVLFCRFKQFPINIVKKTLPREWNCNYKDTPIALLHILNLHAHFTELTDIETNCMHKRWKSLKISWER